MTSGLPTPDPVVTLETEPFWAACAEGRLVLPRCDDCDVHVWYPRRICPSCRGSAVTWVEVSGRGTVYSFTVVRRTGGRWAEVVPYVIASVELDEGPRLLTNVVGCDPDEVRIGMPVAVTFDPSPDGGAVPRFRPGS